jgi:two-component system, NtrC family, sensor kinase
MAFAPTDDPSALRGAFEDAGVGLALVGHDRRWLHANRALERLLGPVAPGEPCPLVDEAPCEAAEYERELAGPDGEPLWLLVTVAATPAHLVVTAHDITARKAAEEDLRRREAELRMIFDDASVGLGLTDRDGRFLHTNRAHAAIYGYEPGAVIGRHFTGHLPEHIRATMIERYHADVAAGVTSTQREVPIRRADGSPGWALVDVGFVRDDAGALRYTVAQVQDVTDRKSAARALEESTARYRALVEHLPMAIFSWGLDPSEGATYVSPQIEAMLGYSVDDWYSRQGLFEDILHPDDRDAVLEQLYTSLANGDDLRCEYRMAAADGRWVTIRMEAVAMTDDQGWPLYLQGYLQDVSEHRRLEQQLRIAQKLESVGQLAAGIAHEINTPIQFVGDSVRFVEEACADLMALIDALEAAEGGPAPELRARVEEAREIADLDYLRERLPAAFERTGDGIRRVSEIVRAMRDFAHPDAGERALIDVNAAVRDTLVVASSQYKLVADAQTELGDVPPVLASGSEIKQVLINLVVNAAHAIADAGAEQRGTIRVRTWRDGDEVAIAVSDTGCGIPAEDRERVFDPFFTTKEVGRGTGQGLAISRAIVHERHGGSIAVDSEVGRGTTIEVRLPIG